MASGFFKALSPARQFSGAGTSSTSDVRRRRRRVLRRRRRWLRRQSRTSNT